MLLDEIEFLNVDEILATIQSDGGLQLTNFLSKETVDSFLSDFEIPLKENINNNNCGLIYYNNQRFISQTLVHSKTTFDFLTHNKFQNLFENYLEEYTLKASRFYQTGGGGISMWHHDEKNSGYQSSGLIIVVYLSDVLTSNQGPFEYIKGTHKISHNLEDDYFWNKNIKEKHGKDIVSCLGKAGTIIIADSKTIHRAMPHRGNYFRTSLFTQVSKLENETYRERLLTNPEFIEDSVIKSKRLTTFLGFGINNYSHIFPPSNIDHMPLNKYTASMIFRWLLRKISKNIFESFPLFIKKIIRKILNRKMDYDSFSN